MKGPVNRGNVWLRGIMGEVAWASVRKRATYFYAQFNRIARRRGRNKAAVAMAHSLLVVIYHVLKESKVRSGAVADLLTERPHVYLAARKDLHP
jgi:transposase